MPTSWSTSTDRCAITSPEPSPCARMASANWAPSWVTGFSAFIALCMTTERSRQRVAESSRAVMVTRSRPLNTTLPELIRAGGLSNWARPNSIVDLPQPDSPTTPTNSPACTSRSKESTARTGPAAVSYSTLRPRTCSTGSSRTGALGTGPPNGSQCGIADLVERVVEQREGGAQEGDAQARGDHPPRLPGVERGVGLRPVQHRSPAQRAVVPKSDELQPGRREHRVEGAAEEVREDQRRHGRQHLEHDDVGPPLPSDAGGLEEVPVPQRERLGAQLPGAVGPAGDHQDADHHRQAALPGVRRDHDDQRERRDDEEDVRDRRERAVGEPAQVGRRHPDQY